MAAEDAGGSGDLAILVNTEMIILKGAVKAAASAGSVTGKVVNKALLSPFRLIQFCMKLHKQCLRKVCLFREVILHIWLSDQHRSG